MKLHRGAMDTYRHLAAVGRPQARTCNDCARISDIQLVDGEMKGRCGFLDKPVNVFLKCEKFEPRLGKVAAHGF
jgi:hypothetical protein